MSTVSNKTRAPLRVPLPRGKTLHLGPGKTGQISASDAEHPGVKALVDAGKIEIVDEGAPSSGGLDGGKNRRGSSQGHVSGGVSRRGGDR